jgi:hypothetical protein
MSLTSVIVTSETKILIKTITLGYDMLPTKECNSYQCPKCNQKTTYHPDFVAANLQGCVKCQTAEIIAKKICEYRGFIFIETFYTDKHMLKFKCKVGENGHECRSRLDEFRRGRGCHFCKKESKRKPEREKIITECDCRSKGNDFKSESGYSLCEHYNFAAVYPKLAEDWDTDLNGETSPYKIAPSCCEEYWFTCKRYRISYQQNISYRTQHNILCPYCFCRSRVCDGNSLLDTHPEICKEWDNEANEILPSEITHGTDYLASWICTEKEGEIHKYKRRVPERTGPYKRGCGECNDKGRDQRTGGHEHFVMKVSKIHNNKYSYPEQYINNKTKINVFCPIISTINNNIHGNFKITPSHHKNGRGCKKCANEQLSSKGVKYLEDLLHKMHYEYEREEPYPGMIYKKDLRVDIALYLTVNAREVRIAIEFDGLQHEKPINFWGGVEGLEKTQHRDYLKDLYCVENGICMLRFSDASLPTLEELKNLIELCKTRQIYKSYPHLQNRVKAETILTNIHVITTSFLKEN